MKDKLTILIVEDEILTAKSLQMDLEELGFNVLKPVSKGEVAVDVALQENPSLILMDIRLAGGLDGIEAAEEILKKKKIPIVFMTGYATEYIQERIPEISLVDILEKPVSINKIKEILDTLKKNM
ncbi:response regulator [candidate division KSB1 bacterium]|nr:response regulator [candidate division KSB1 bacterium]